MRVRDWMTSEVVTVTPQTSVLNARRLLACHGVRHLPVVDGDQLVGIVSDRDVNIGDPLLLGCLSALQSDLATGRYRPVSALMSGPVAVIQPDARVSGVARILVERQIGALPVVEAGAVVGIITTVDCLRALLHAQAAADRRRDRHPPAPEVGPEIDAEITEEHLAAVHG